MNYYTPEVVDHIMRAKGKMPAGWKIVTREEPGWLVLVVDFKEFEKLNIWDRIKIAENLNELCEQIKGTGIPCYIEKT